MNAVLNFYKPPGMSSAQAVSFIKAMTGEKTGHAGTLDPEAAGVLPVLLGRATKACDYLMDSDKQYLAEIAFGEATDTQDAQGKVISTGQNYPEMTALKEAVKAFMGEVQQLPPQYSALKVQGKSAYQLAREGKQARLLPRMVRIDDIKVLSKTERNGFLMRVRCGKGAYIRTLCHDLGVKLGCPSHMRFLLREESAGLTIGEAITPQELLAWKNGEAVPSPFMSVESVLTHLPFWEIPVDLRHKAINGVALPQDVFTRETIPENTKVCLTLGGHLLGVFEADRSMLKIRAMLMEPSEFARPDKP